MTLNSRRKGKTAELEVAAILRDHGYEARRDGRLDTDLDHNVPGVHLEVKRREKLEIDKWCRQAEEEAGDLVPVVVYRRSNQPWRVVMPFTDFLEGWNL